MRHAQKIHPLHTVIRKALEVGHGQGKRAQETKKKKKKKGAAAGGRSKTKGKKRS
jgi:hypothetical protein